MRRPVLLSLLPGAALALSAAASAQTPSWKAELLGTPPPTWSLTAVVAVNDTGLVVGNTYVSSAKRVFVAAPGQGLTILPIPPEATFAQAYDMDTRGVVVGNVTVGGGASRAAVWRPGPTGYAFSYVPAGPGGQIPLDARGVNDRGDVVGKFAILGDSYYWNEDEGVVLLPASVFPAVPADVNEERQVVSGSLRMDLDTLVLESLGNPTGTGFSYTFTQLSSLNDAGECAGYAVVATSQPPYVPVRYSDGPAWKVFSTFPWTSASALGLAESGDTVFQLGTFFGLYVHVDGFGSLSLQGTLAPASSHWDLTGTLGHAISRGGRMACTGTDTLGGETGVLLLTPLAFEDLGGAIAGSRGDPVLSGFGQLVPGTPTRLRLAAAAPSGLAFLAWSPSSLPIPLFGGVFHANPATFFLPLPTDALGRAELAFGWPPTLPGATYFQQAFVLDPGTALGFSMSNGLRAVAQ